MGMVQPMLPLDGFDASPTNADRFEQIKVQKVKESDSATWTCCGGVELDRTQNCPFCGEKFNDF